VLLIAALVGTLVSGTAAGAVMLTAGPALLGAGSVAVRQLLSGYGFTVAESPDGLRLRHGLLDTRSQTIPDGRVQAVRIREPLLWRRAGWVRVDVDVAGYGGTGEQQLATSALLPVAPRELAEHLVARVLGAELPPADRPVPPAARWRAPLQARRLRVGVDAQHVVSTSGVLTTTTDIAPAGQGAEPAPDLRPVQRRLGLATVHVDTAGRRLPGAVLPHRDAADAAALLDDLTERARAARSGGREQLAVEVFPYARP
jgi:putative membrane protein